MVACLRGCLLTCLSFLTFVCLTFFVTSVVWAEEKAILRATSSSYSESSGRLIATGNVKLSYGDVTIESDLLIIDKEKFVTSDKPVTIRRGEDVFNSSSLFFDLSSDRLILTEIAVNVTPPDAKRPLRLIADKIIDEGSIKQGDGGLITSCSLAQPHYYVWAPKFDYETDRYVSVRGGADILGVSLPFPPPLLWNPILLAPLIVPFPYYHYQLGKRRVIWNFPRIGKRGKGVHGWFVQNTIDYNRLVSRDSFGKVFKKDASIYIDLFQHEEHNQYDTLGVGFQQPYELTDLFGTEQLGYLKLYKMKRWEDNRYKDWLNDTVSPSSNYKAYWEHSILVKDLSKGVLSPIVQAGDFLDPLGVLNPLWEGDLRLKWHYDYKNGIQIKSKGRQHNLDKSLLMSFNDISDDLQLSLTEKQNFLVNQPRFSDKIQVSRHLNSKLLYDFNKNRVFNYSAKQDTTTTKLAANWDIGRYSTFKLNQNLYEKLDYDDEDTELVKRFRHTYELTSVFTPTFSMSVKVDSQDDWRPEEKRVTADSNYNYFYRLPEFQFKWKSSGLSLPVGPVLSLPFDVSYDWRIGRYQEYRYFSEDPRVFPANSDFSWSPNTAIIKQSFSQNYSDLWLDSNFTFSGAYDQFLFFFPKDLKGFSDDGSVDQWRDSYGDMTYQLKLAPSLTSKIGSFMEMKSQYHWADIPFSGNSPFYEFNSIRPTQRKNKLTETLTFYIDKTSRYKWSHTTGFDWILNKPDMYVTDILVKPVTEFEFKLKADARTEGKSFYKSSSWDWRKLNADINISSLDWSPSLTGWVSWLPIRSSMPSFLKWLLPLSSQEWMEQFTLKVSRLNIHLEKDFKTQQITNSYMNLKFQLGDQKAYRWEFDGTFNYNQSYTDEERLSGDPGKIISSRYVLQNFSVIRYDHCRKYTLTYNFSLERLTFLFTISAFPNDSFGFKKTKDLFEIEGIFDEKAEEHL